MSARQIRIVGLRVHNLKGVSLTLPIGTLIAVTGVSGSGKSSLALDTLFAEGQRRYVETFSPYTRQFLERLDRPDAQLIEGIPPAIAIRQRPPRYGTRATVGSVTEIDSCLQLLMARAGTLFCPDCNVAVQVDTTESIVDALTALLRDSAAVVAFPQPPGEALSTTELAAQLTADGFTRVIIGDRIVTVGDLPSAVGRSIRVVADRLTRGGADAARLRDSVELALDRGEGRCEIGALDASTARVPRVQRFSRDWRCGRCERLFSPPEPSAFSSRSSLGACAACRGFGDEFQVDMELVVPDASKSLNGGALAPWNESDYRHELDELKALAPDYDIPLDTAYCHLTPEQVQRIWEGVPERQFGGLRGFFAWLERHRYKPQVRLFLNRWRRARPCSACRGSRLRPDALWTRLAECDIHQIQSMPAQEALDWIESLGRGRPLDLAAEKLARKIAQRLQFLVRVGVGYLTLSRPARSLSSGESQRVALTRALGSGLVNMLYVLDEPSNGLHRRDTERLLLVVRELCQLGNTVVLVEHDAAFIAAADYIVDLGPGAGAAGGDVVYAGPADRLFGCEDSQTATWLRRVREPRAAALRRSPSNVAIQVRGACGNNLKGIHVAFPLGLLCVVTGVSGSGKSTLVEATLFRGLASQLGKSVDRPAPHQAIEGVDQIGDCLFFSQDWSGRSSRSNPATYVKAFDAIRRGFAETADARLRNFTPGHFSFNVAGGRCAACDGLGRQVIDMQFLADVSVTCPACQGRRYGREVLEVKLRGKHIAEVLELTARDAIEFFRGKPDIQEPLQALCAVGLDYLQVGQSCDTLSGGEIQRLKLAELLAATSRSGSLLILDEPTRGLHAADVDRLLTCLRALLDVGHSLVVIEHNLDFIDAADWVIDLGPDSAAAGGQLVACGPPEQIAACAASHTGRWLAERNGPPPRSS